MHELMYLPGTPMLREALRRLLRTRNRARGLLSDVYGRAFGRRHYLFRITRPANDANGPCSVVVAGSETIADAYNSFFFERAGRIEKIRPVSGLALARSAAKTATTDDDLVVWEAWPWQRKSTSEYLALEAWSDAVLEFDGSDLATFIHANVSATIERRIKKYQQNPCEVELSDDEQDLEHFYELLCKPLSRKRHGENAHTSTLEMQKSYGSYTVAKLVMFLKQDGQRVAGMLLLNDLLNSRLTIQEYGIAAPLLDEPKRFQEIYSGMNYSAIEWARHNGIREVSFGGSRNQLNSGVYFYKKQWGACFHRMRQREAVCAKFVSSRKAQLLAEFPLIYFDRHEPCGLIGWQPKDDDPNAAVDELVRIANAFACRNMKAIKVVMPSDALYLARSLPQHALERARVRLSFEC